MRRIEAGTFNRHVHDPEKRSRTSEWAQRGHRRNEQLSAREPGTIPSKVHRDTAAYVGRERELFDASSFVAANRDDSSFPINVVQRQREHLCWSKAEPSEKKKDGTVPASERCTPMARPDHLFDLVLRNGTGQLRLGPVRYDGNRPREIAARFAPEMKETQERSKCDDDVLGVDDTCGSRVEGDETRSIVGT
jgi:hypothetical protein